MKGRPARAAVLLALALGCAACAQTGLPAAGVEVARGERREHSPRVEARIDQTGSTVTLTARGTCNLRRFRTLERITTHVVPSAQQQSSGWGGLGAAAMVTAALGADAGGGIVLGEALSASPASTSKAVGGALLSVLGVGLTALTIWVIKTEARRSSGLVTEPVDEDVDDGLVRENVPCLDAASVPAHEPVLGRLPGPGRLIEVHLGETDENGKLQIDLAGKLPPAPRMGLELPETMLLYIRGSHVGSVRLDEVRRAEAQQRETEQKAADRQAEENARAGAKASAAGEAARRGAAAACRQICKASCQGTASCTEGCVAQGCQ